MRNIFTFAIFYYPVIYGAMVLKFHSADGVSYAFVCVLERVGEVVHGVDAPVVACAMVS